MLRRFRRYDAQFRSSEAKDHALLIEHLRLARSGAAFQKPTYAFATRTRCADVVTIAPSSYLIVEGLHLLADDELRNMFDLTIFLDTDEANRKDLPHGARHTRIATGQRNTRWRNSQACAADARVYVEPQREHADLVLTYDRARNIDDYVIEIEQHVLEANT